MNTIIKFESVDISYQKNIVLEDVNFEIKENQFVFLTGKIGSGKSSLLKAIYAETPLKNGSLKVFDYEISKIKRNEIPFLRRQIGFIFQDFNFLNDRNIYKNLKFILEATGWTENEKIDTRIEEVLADVGMLHKKASFTYELSGGELQRISLARALLNSPKLFLADEPTGNLDEESSEYVTQKLIEQADNGSSVIFVTHNKNLLKLAPNAIKYQIEEKRVVKTN